MDSVAGTAREREVIDTIAEAILSALCGRTLRVAVVSTPSDDIGFADGLTRALHARGCDCRRQTGRGSGTATVAAGPAGTVTGACVVAIMTRSAPSADVAEICRIDIRVNHGSAAPGVRAFARGDGLTRAGADEPVPDVVVDYLGVDGPVISYLNPSLLSRSGSVLRCSTPARQHLVG